MGREILVDGYNVIKNNEMFQAMEIKNLALARNLLVKQLHNRYRHTTHRITVVFDGNGATEQVSHEDHVRIIFSRHGETADSVIARLAAEARAQRHEVEMYSDDKEVRSAVTEQGGQAQSTRRLTTHLNAAPSDVAYRAKYRQAMRRMYGIDPMYKDDDEPEPYRPKSSRKKKKKKRN